MKKICAVCLNKFWFKSGTRLRCGHVYHPECVQKICEYKRQCPLCETYIYDELSEKLLCATQETQIRKMVKNIKQDQLLPLFKEAIDGGRELLREALVDHAAVNKDIVNDFIVSENTPILRQLLASNKVNVHATVNGLTVVERALETNNRDLIIAVLKHCCLSTAGWELARPTQPPPPIPDIYPSLAGL